MLRFSTSALRILMCDLWRTGVRPSIVSAEWQILSRKRRQKGALGVQENTWLHKTPEFQRGIMNKGGYM